MPFLLWLSQIVNYGSLICHSEVNHQLDNMQHTACHLETCKYNHQFTILEQKCCSKSIGLFWQYVFWFRCNRKYTINESKNIRLWRKIGRTYIKLWCSVGCSGTTFFVLYKNDLYSNKICNQTTFCRWNYNASNFIPNPHKWHPIARPCGRGMGVFCEFILWLSSAPVAAVLYYDTTLYWIALWWHSTVLSNYVSLTVQKLIRWYVENERAISIKSLCFIGYPMWYLLTTKLYKTNYHRMEWILISENRLIFCTHCWKLWRSPIYM